MNLITIPGAPAADATLDSRRELQQRELAKLELPEWYRNAAAPTSVSPRMRGFVHLALQAPFGISLEGIPQLPTLFAKLEKTRGTSPVHHAVLELRHLMVLVDFGIRRLLPLALRFTGSTETAKGLERLRELWNIQDLVAAEQQLASIQSALQSTIIAKRDSSEKMVLLATVVAMLAIFCTNFHELLYAAESHLTGDGDSPAPATRFDITGEVVGDLLRLYVAAHAACGTLASLSIGGRGATELHDKALFDLLLRMAEVTLGAHKGSPDASPAGPSPRTSGS